MQQPKIEVRARDERRRDEACAKWSTVERERGMREGKRDRERGYEVLWEKKKKKKARWEAEQREGTRKNEEGRKMRGEERGNWEVMFVTRICQNVKINSTEANQCSYRTRSQGWMQTLVEKSKGTFLWREAQMCFSYLTYVPVLRRGNPVGLLDLMDWGGSGWEVLVLIKNLSKHIPKWGVR